MTSYCFICSRINPAVTLYFALTRELRVGTALAYAATQIICAVLGVYLAHAMFGTAIFEVSHKLRDGPDQALSEFMATFGLIATIAGSIRFRPALTPLLVGLYIASAYWFTASTSFANPAVTVARSLTDSFAGIAPHSVPAFIGAQIVAAIAGFLVCSWLFAPASTAQTAKSIADEREVAPI